MMGQQRHAFGPFILDASRGELLREGRRLALGQRALALLEILLEADGRPVGKDRLLAEAWPGTIVEEVNLTVQVAALRKALGTMPDGRDWIVTVPRLGYRLPRASEPDPAATEHSGPASIAVLPFENLSSDPEQRYFADGLAEDLITALSRFKSFAVLARQSSFLFASRQLDVREAARELGVRYVLEGSVRRLGNAMRVTAQLVDAETGMHLWAEKFDGGLGEVFDFEEKIIDAVVGVVEPEIRRAEIERARRKRPQNLDAYDLYLQAVPRFYNVEPDGYAAAIGMLERAIALQPDFALALAYCAWAHERRCTLGLPGLEANSARAIELARASLRAGGDDPQVLAISSLVLLLIAGEAATGLETARRAARLSPNNVIVLNMLCTCNIIAGDLDEAMFAARRICDLSPGAPESYEATSAVGQVMFHRGQYSDALPWLERAMIGGITWEPAYWYLAATLARLDRMAEARDVVQRLLQFAPNTAPCSRSRQPGDGPAGYGGRNSTTACASPVCPRIELLRKISPRLRDPKARPAAGSARRALLAHRGRKQ